MEEDNKWTGGERKTDGKAQFLSFSPLVFSPSCWLILNQSLSILSWAGWVKVDEEEVEEDRWKFYTAILLNFLMESRPVWYSHRLLITRFDEVHQLARDNIENHFILDLFVPSSVMDDTHTRGWMILAKRIKKRKELEW